MSQDAVSQLVNYAKVLGILSAAFFAGVGYADLKGDIENLQRNVNVIITALAKDGVIEVSTLPPNLTYE